MILKKLVLENLRSYESQTIEFPLGSTLLSGDIGSGKTTILLAIEFAIFGLQPSQKGGSLIRNGFDNSKVILEFEIDGKEVVIVRTLKRGKKSITQDYVSLTVNDERFEESVTEIKAKILDLLNYPAEFAKKTNLLYKFTVYTPQEEMKQIILESKDIRLNTLRHVFGIDKYKRIQENTNILTGKIREKTRINEILFRDLDSLKEELVGKEEGLIVLKNGLVGLDIEYKKIVELVELRDKLLEEVRGKIDEKKNLENEKDKIGMLIVEKRKQTSDIEANISSLKKQISETLDLKINEEEYKALDDRIEFQRGKETELQKEYMNVIGKVKSMEVKKYEAESLINKISGLERCPTCLQEVSQESTYQSYPSHSPNSSSHQSSLLLLPTIYPSIQPIQQFSYIQYPNTNNYRET